MMLSSGSIQIHPVQTTINPPTTITTDENRSPSMWSRALRVFRSSAPERASQNAVTTLTISPPVATTIISRPRISTGLCSRSTASTTMKTVTTTSPQPLNKEARISERNSP